MDPSGLVIFDCDGVLVDSERLTVAIEARLLTELGAPYSEQDVVDAFMGRTAAAGQLLLERLLGPELAAEFDRRSTTEIRQAFSSSLTPVAGVERVLAALRARNLPHCVASSGSHEKMRLTLGLTGLAHQFDGRIFSASEVPRGKPFPDLFLHAAWSMGVDPARCVVVEDSVPGVHAAVAAGMTAYGFTGGLAAAGSLAAAGAIPFERMEELLQEFAPGGSM
ncbi:HAD family hydrolase [Paeniglutamicibacter antarcticus]|uniref:HAD family hydrolase n=1 Tax=Arthrobacter terrae TaxID=2935737 RepID=A0A931G4V7_9MICC|nr:HAD family hydrolase [Arthrobacter terrae]MBG0740156.1 HAD family hydrolase [Arthrobacter terrae]